MIDSDRKVNQHIVNIDHSHEFVTTDSAASASALASGRKTHFDGVGVIPGTKKADEENPVNHLETFFDLAKTQGLGRGVVATSRVVHATPAAFYAHRQTRKSYQDIAKDLVSAELDVVLGAGWQYFRARSDNEDLVEKIKDSGIDYFEDSQMIDDFADSSTRLMGLFYKKDMPLLADRTRSVSLSKMVETAIKVLDRGRPEGWVLMVEGSFIDRCEHDLRPDCTFLETKDFDEAVGVARTYAKNRTVKDTLIVVTADHETGGLSIIDSEEASSLAQNVRSQNANDPEIEQTIAKGEGFKVGNYFETQTDKIFSASFGSMSQASAILWNRPFFKAAHTPNFVPIFAEGPSAKFIAASQDNAMLGLNLKRIVSNEGFEPKLDESTPKSMILFLGECLGIAAVTLGNYSEGKSNMLQMEEHGMISPTQIGGGATSSTHALLAGKNEFNTDNLLSLAAEEGKSVAIISDRFDGTVLNIVENNREKVDFILGFDPKNETRAQTFESMGYQLQDTWPPTIDVPTFGDFGSLLGGAQTNLPDAFSFAFNRLVQNPKGFLLILDLSRSNEEAQMLEKLKDFNATVQRSLDADRSDTLILITGDRDQTMSVIDNHYAFVKRQCGAASRCGGDFKYEDHDVVKEGGFRDSELQGADFEPVVMLQYAWLVRASEPLGEPKNRTNTYSENFLPLFAQGAGSSLFRGFYSQKEIGELLLSFVKESN